MPESMGWAIGWAHRDLQTAAKILVRRTKAHWLLPWNVPTYLYLEGVVKECYEFLERVGDLHVPEVDFTGAKFWFRKEGNRVRIERYELPRRGRDRGDLEQARGRLEDDDPLRPSGTDR